MEKTVNVTIKGISPLLMNKPNMLEIQDKAKVKQSGKNILEQQYEEKQYLTPDGELYIPDTHLKGCLVEAGKNLKVKGKGKATYSKIIGYAIMVVPGQILHKKTNLEKYTVLAVNPHTKGRNAVCRPILNEWEADFQLEYDADEVPFEVLKEALDYGGKRVGIGDWRPQKKGTFGRFVVTRFEEAK